MSVINAAALLAAAGGDYQISRSVRFRSSASANLSRTFSTTRTNASIQTFSFWVKRGALSVASRIMDCFDGTSTNSTVLYFAASDAIQFDFGGAAANTITTTQVFRDPSAWYHIVVAIDTTQATASNRVKIYVNGGQITAFSTATYPALNATSQWVVNNANNRIMSQWGGGSAYTDGYLTEINFIDGQALTPSSFGQTNTITGVWQPIKYTGTYGTNGFYLNFSDNSAATAAAIGKDYSGNGNNWTPNNISVTAGATYDSMLDVPTQWADGGNGRGNYCVLNPLIVTTAGSPADGNLKFSGTNATSWSTTNGTMGVSSGKWYWEETITTIGANAAAGISDPSVLHGTFSLGGKANGYGYIASTGNKQGNAGAATAYGATFTTGDVIGVALDMDAGTLTFYKNNVSQGVAFTGLTGVFAPAAGNFNSGVLNINFGQQPFTYTPPTGFKALNTQNLPDSTIKKGNQYFDVTTYTGDGTSSKVITGLNFQPDMVWLKVRNAIDNHGIVDAVRGAPALIYPNATTAETAAPLQGSVGSFNSNGFTIAAGATNNANFNTNANTYAAWSWNAGGATVTNNAGSISSQVRANPTAGISVVTYTSTGANATVGHGLGVAPSLIVVKNKASGTTNWPAYHKSASAGGSLFLNSATAYVADTTMWQNTAPTSTVFSVGTNANLVSGATVAYCFAEVAGFSKFGTYTGNASTDGPFVYCGFKPRFLLLKNSAASGNWIIIDTARDLYNVSGAELQPSTTAAEAVFSEVDILSNGFKLRITTNPNAANTYVFAAFAENPFKNALAR